MTGRRHRWNSIGRTRRKLAEILTAYMQAIPGADGKPRFAGYVVNPDDIHPMRLAGLARKYEDAHSWEASATSPRGGPGPRFYSYDNMTECVRAGKLHPVGDDGEVGT